MLTWWTMLVTNVLLLPGIMILAGYFMYKHPPKEINGLMGYRTRRSMMNQDTWAFAHDLCGRIWMRAGTVILVIALVIQLLLLGRSEAVIGGAGLVISMAEVAALIVSILPVERALKATFDENGSRK